jgi:hypothetical protein
MEELKYHVRSTMRLYSKGILSNVSLVENRVWSPERVHCSGLLAPEVGMDRARSAVLPVLRHQRFRQFHRYP